MNKLAKSKLVVASGNAGKLAELRRLMSPRNMQLVAQAELGIDDIPETGKTFVENALLKARHASNEAGLPALADDSGLVVPALQGAPGLYSARYAGEDATDALNNQLLLRNMQSLSGTHRQAWFHCTLVLLQHADDPDPLIATGRWQGRIAEQPGGSAGFGYDPLFIADGDTCTAAELHPDEKARRCHRGLAMAELLKQFVSIEF